MLFLLCQCRYGNATVVENTERGWRDLIFLKIRAVFGFGIWLLQYLSCWSFEIYQIYVWSSFKSWIECGNLSNWIIVMFVIALVDYVSKLGLNFILVSQNNRFHVGIFKNQWHIHRHVLLRSDYDFIRPLLIFLENVTSVFMTIYAFQLYLFDYHIRNFKCFTIGMLRVSWPIVYDLSHWVLPSYMIDYLAFSLLVTIL